MMTTDILTVISCLLMGAGLVFTAVSVIGTYRFRFVMNRMHCAAVIDTLGLGFIITGLMLLCRDIEYVPKLALILAVQWIGSPIASHMVGRLEAETDPELINHMLTETVVPEETEDVK